MKFLGWILSAGLIVVSLGVRASEGGTVGNGGDGVAAEFVLTAQTAAELLKGVTLNDVPEFNLHSFIGAVSSVTVSSEDRLFLEGTEVDAINYPEEQRMKVSRSRWMPLRADAQTIPRFLLVIHEYLWLSGVDDSNYQLSKILLQKMSPSKFSTQKWWEPMNPTNMIGFRYSTSGCGETHGDWGIEFDLKQDHEDKSLIIKPESCGSERLVVRAIKTTKYGASTDGLKGKYHIFEVTVTNQSGNIIGNLTYSPEWGRCLIMSDSYCSQSGDFYFGNTSFSFQMRK